MQISNLLWLTLSSSVLAQNTVSGSEAATTTSEPVGSGYSIFTTEVVKPSLIFLTKTRHSSEIVSTIVSSTTVETVVTVGSDGATVKPTYAHPLPYETAISLMDVSNSHASSKIGVGVGVGVGVPAIMLLVGILWWAVRKRRAMKPNRRSAPVMSEYEETPVAQTA